MGLAAIQHWRRVTATETPPPTVNQRLAAGEQAEREKNMLVTELGNLRIAYGELQAAAAVAEKLAVENAQLRAELCKVKTDLDDVLKLIEEDSMSRSKGK